MAHDQGTKAHRALPRTVLLLGLTSFFTDAGGDLIFPLLPAFMASLGASPTFLGLVEGLADATAALLKLGSGELADRLPRKKPLVLFGYGLASLVRPLVALATAPWHVLFVRVTDRVGKGVRSAPRDVLIASAAEAGGAGRAFGFHVAMDHAGAVVGPLTGALLLGLGWSVRDVFLLAAVPGVLSLLALSLVKETPLPSSRPTEVAPPPAAAVRRLPAALRGYLAILLLFSLANSSDAFLLLRARDLGVSIAQIPLLWTALHVSKVASSYLGGSWSDRMPRTRLILVGWLVYAGSYLALGQASAAWHVWALFLVYGLYYGLSEPAEKALVKDLAPGALRGRAFGAYNFIVGASAVPASLLTGWLWTTWGPRAALGVGAAVAGVAALLLLVWSRTAPPAVARTA